MGDKFEKLIEQKQRDSEGEDQELSKTNQEYVPNRRERIYNFLK